MNITIENVNLTAEETIDLIQYAVKYKIYKNLLDFKVYLNSNRLAETTRADYCRRLARFATNEQLFKKSRINPPEHNYNNEHGATAAAVRKWNLFVNS